MRLLLIAALQIVTLSSNTTQQYVPMLPYDQFGLNGHIYYVKDWYPDMEDDLVRSLRLKYFKIPTIAVESVSRERTVN